MFRQASYRKRNIRVGIFSGKVCAFWQLWVTCRFSSRPSVYDTQILGFPKTAKTYFILFLPPVRRRLPSSLGQLILTRIFSVFFNYGCNLNVYIRVNMATIKCLPPSSVYSAHAVESLGCLPVNSSIVKPFLRNRIWLVARHFFCLSARMPCSRPCTRLST